MQLSLAKNYIQQPNWLFNSILSLVFYLYFILKTRMEKITKNIAHTTCLMYNLCMSRLLRVINELFLWFFRKKLLCFEIKDFFTV